MLFARSAALELLLRPHWQAAERRTQDLHYPCAPAYDDEDKSNEEEDAPAREAMVGFGRHVLS